MKRNASALLLGAVVLFITMRLTTDGSGWTGYVEAAAEAAVVGGVADWFAVTALFRHPLRLPIPHTAIIPNRKDQLGRSLGTFVQDNFLNGDLVAQRLVEFRVAERVGDWMSQPLNARKVGQQSAAVIGGITEVLNDDDIAAGMEAVLIRRLEAVPLAPLLSRAFDVAIDGNHHQAAFDAALRGIDRIVAENDQVLRKRLYDESPWWVPESMDDRVFDKIASGISRVVADVLADPHHELRALADNRMRQFTERLSESPDMAARGEDLKAQLLAHPEVRAWLNSLWDHVKVGLIEAADDPDSELRRRLEAAIVSGGQVLAADPELRAKVDRWVEGVVRYAIDQSQNEVAGLIASTVQRWDAQQTGDLIELQVGRDLQFIRINGTVVGALVGVALHAVGMLF